MRYLNIPRFVMNTSLVLRFAIAQLVLYKWWGPQSSQEETVKRCIHIARDYTKVRNFWRKTIVKIKVIKTKAKGFWTGGAEELMTEAKEE